MRLHRLIRAVHIGLFFIFSAAAGAGLWSWISSGKLEGLVVGATAAAFAATCSAFVERIFPLDER